MGAEFKFGKNRGTASEGAAKPPNRRGRKAALAADAWDWTPQVADESDDEIDCLRMLQGSGFRSLPVHDDDDS